MNVTAASKHLVEFAAHQESRERPSARSRGQGCERGWIGWGWGRSQGVGCSSLHLFALAWWPPGVASFCTTGILGKFQVVWEGVLRPLAPSGSCAAEFFLGPCQGCRSSESHPLQKAPSQVLGYRTEGRVAGAGTAQAKAGRGRGSGWGKSGGQWE